MLLSKVVKLIYHDGKVVIDDDDLARLVVAIKNTNGFFRLDVRKPFVRRTTGKNSQNHAINGYIQQLCVATGAGFDGMKEYCKRRAIERGYGYITLSNGDVLGKSEADASIEEGSILIDAIKQLAAELGVKLYEA